MIAEQLLFAIRETAHAPEMVETINHCRRAVARRDRCLTIHSRPFKVEINTTLACSRNVCRDPRSCDTIASAAVCR